MKNKKESLVLGRMLQKLAPSIGASVLLEQEWGLVGQITFKSGRRSYFKYNTLDLNSVGSSEIAKDKDYSYYFMERMGYPVVPGSKAFYSKQWAEDIGSKSRGVEFAYRHAAEIGFPVFVKPNSGSQGSGVALVHNKRELFSAIRAVFKSDRIALVQQPVHGRDYRLVVLDEKIISAYERIPLHVIGDGRSTIFALLKWKQKEFVASRRDTMIKIGDPRISLKLARQGMSLRSVPGDGLRVYLLDNANLSSGGDSVDVTASLNRNFSDLAVRLTKDMGLRLCGVDIMVDGDIAREPQNGKYWILEINAAPGLDHYARSGAVQEKIVEGLYLEVLKHLDY